MNSTDDMREPDEDQISTPLAPHGCADCAKGVQVTDQGRIVACVDCTGRGVGHVDDQDAEAFVVDCLTALAEVREILWPGGRVDDGWSPDTIDEVARRLAFLRLPPDTIPPEAVRYSGTVKIELRYDDSDGCYYAKVRVGHITYATPVGAPAIGHGPGIAFDSAEAFDRVAHAALSVPAADTVWGEGSDIFTPAAETNDSGWIIQRRPPRGGR
jgi:hypothetical protein